MMNQCPERFGQGEREVERVPVLILIKSVRRLEGYIEILGSGDTTHMLAGSGGQNLCNVLPLFLFCM